MSDNDPVVIMVNISRSIRRPEISVKKAARRAWNPRVVEDSDILKRADILVAVAMNVIRGVFNVKAVKPDTEFPDLIAFDLVPSNRYSAVIGCRLPDDGPMWLARDNVEWKVYSVKYLNQLLEDPEKGVVLLGGNKIMLLAHGGLRITLAPGASIEIEQASSPALRARLEPLIKALVETEFCTTTQVLADALNSSAQAVYKSLEAGRVFTNAEIARVLHPRYRTNADGWVVPPNDELKPDEMIDTPNGPIKDPNPYRGHYLVAEGIGEERPDGSVTLENHFVITNAVTLRRFLQT